MTQVSFSQLVSHVKTVLVNAGYSAHAADVLANNCATAERDGSQGHGVFRLKDYVATIESGYVNGSPQPGFHDAGPAFLRVDADNGFAQIAIEAARETIMAKARETGMAILAIRNSHHLGALYLDVEPFAEQGLVAIALVNSIAVVAPPGGHRGVYGTNPLAFAAPRLGHDPIVFDQASSIMAHGDLQIAAREGKLLPAGAGIDRAGRLTDSPHAILNGGALSTFGGHKGASIALMVELLCAALVGADFSFEVDWSANPGARTARTGETIIVIDPSAGAAGLASFAARAGMLIQALIDAGQGRIPGDRRLHHRKGDGTITLSAQNWTSLQTYLDRNPQAEPLA